MKCKTVAPDKYDTVEFEFWHNPKITDTTKEKKKEKATDDKPKTYPPMIARFNVDGDERVLIFLAEWKIGEALDNLQSFLLAATDEHERNNL